MTGQTEPPLDPGSETGTSRLRRLPARVRTATLFASGVLAALLAIGLYGALAGGPKPLTPNDVNQSIASALASQTPEPALSQQVYEVIQPSLVLIQTKGPKAVEDPHDSIGSGVLVNGRGDILTSLHVVADATSIELTFADGTKSTAEIVGASPEDDIAVLRAASLPEVVVPATLGNPAAARSAARPTSSATRSACTAR